VLGLSRKRRQEKHSRKAAAFETAQTEQQIYDLVRERMLAAVGPGGIWSVSLRTAADIDTFFAETIAEAFARDLAGHITRQKVAEGLPTFAPDPVTGVPIENTAPEVIEPRVIEPIDARLVA
jgi:hypothetical protein